MFDSGCVIGNPPVRVLRDRGDKRSGWLPGAGAGCGILLGSAVLLFKCPEKAGIVFKSVLVVDLPDGLSGQNGIFAGMKTLFQYILVKRDAHIILEYMGNMKFAYVEKGSQAVQAQIFLQMPVDVIADVQVQKIFIYCGPLMDHIIYYPVHIDEKRNGHELRGLPLEGPAAAQFFQRSMSFPCSAWVAVESAWKR